MVKGVRVPVFIISVHTFYLSEKGFLRNDPFNEEKDTCCTS